MLSDRGKVSLHVFYTWPQGVGVKYDPDFLMEVEWDQPLLDGYSYTLVENTSDNPGSKRFRGVVNPDLIEKIIDIDPAAILIYGWRFHSHLKVMRYFKGRIPILFRGDSHLLDERWGIRSFSRRMTLRWIYRYVDKVLYCGSNNLDYFKVHGVKSSHLFFMPHCVDNDFFSSRNTSRSVQALDRRRELGIKDTQIVIAFVGKFVEKKNPNVLAEALQDMPVSMRDKLVLLFVGSGILEGGLRTLANELPSAVVRVLPFQNQSELPIIYRMADVLALPSKGPGETWGLVVNEAMASSRAVLVSDRVGCARDIVENRGTGWVFSFKKKLSLSLALQEISKIDREDLLERGKRANRVILDYSLENAAKCIEDCILVKGHRSK